MLILQWKQFNFKNRTALILMSVNICLFYARGWLVEMFPEYAKELFFLDTFILEFSLALGWFLFVLTGSSNNSVKTFAFGCVLAFGTEVIDKSIDFAKGIEPENSLWSLVIMSSMWLIALNQFRKESKTQK